MISYAGFFICLRNSFNSLPDFLYRTTAVKFAEIQVQRARRDQSGDVGCVAILEPAGDEVREAVQQARAMNDGISRMSAIPHKAFQSRLPGAYQPCVR